MNSVPGVCSLSRLGTTNAQVFGMDAEGRFDKSRLDLVYTAVKDRYLAVTQGKTESDPLKVFVKQEPHKVEKLKDDRLRLIMSVSLVDALVDRILFMRLANQVIKKHTLTNILIGWSPLGGGYRLIDALFPGETISIDKKAWDWSVPYWLLEAVKGVIKRLAVDAPQWWHDAVDTRFSCLFGDPEFVFPDGTRGRQEQPGIMKSGCYLTILINSIAQLVLHEMAKVSLGLGDEVEPVVVLGDDSLQRKFDRWQEYVDYITALGFRCEVEHHSDEPEFAGFRYRDKFKPAYFQKHLFNLAHLTTDREVAQQTLQNYQLLYYFDEPMRRVITDMIRILNMPEAAADELRLRALAMG
ncbi:hypothetical protein 3 [Hubei sobemo-like virus 13]|uniref:hypothetical protein 3 n=1 Tax=Hubei sobemo-like virus 13 TaxID=1923198 RepID=UPI00090A6770|nr:hypothetical protein 3 [Hubei sobemo-like virus 13]APG75955.1 hypothetical protein 3 [Hubei sobemo-like virus 13]